MSFGLDELRELAEGGGASAEGANLAPMGADRGVLMAHSEGPVQLNGAEVEGHASDGEHHEMRLGQTTSIPGKDRGDTMSDPFPPCRNAWPEERGR